MSNAPVKGPKPPRERFTNPFAEFPREVGVLVFASFFVAVGFGLTVTVTVPENVPTQFTSDTAVKEYVLVDVGETEIK